MLATVAALAIVIWFYKSALAVGKEPLPSAFLGFIVFFVPAVAWTLVVTPGLRDMVEHNPASLLAYVAQYAYILVGAASAAWVKTKHFATTDTPPEE